MDLKIISQTGEHLPDSISNKYPKAFKVIEQSIRKSNKKTPTIMSEDTLDILEQAIVGFTDIQSTENFFNDDSFDDYECTTFKFRDGGNFLGME